LLGEVNNTPSVAVNNGVQVALRKSTWTVAGTSYINLLTIDDASHVVAPAGHQLQSTVDGVVTTLQSGSYKGQIVLTVK
jgi:hypothetical protein